MGFVQNLTFMLAEKTRNMLMKGSIKASKSQSYQSTALYAGKGKKVLGPAFGKKASQNKCITCRRGAVVTNLLRCEFCEKEICLDCTRVCNGCEKTFCHVCSVIK